MTDSRGSTVQEIITRANDSMDVQQASIADLGALFSAIRKESDEGSTIHRLAGMGMYLSEEWAHMAEESKIQPTSTQSGG